MPSLLPPYIPFSTLRDAVASEMRDIELLKPRCHYGRDVDEMECIIASAKALLYYYKHAQNIALIGDYIAAKKESSRDNAIAADSRGTLARMYQLTIDEAERWDCPVKEFKKKIVDRLKSQMAFECSGIVDSGFPEFGEWKARKITDARSRIAACERDIAEYQVASARYEENMAALRESIKSIP